MLDFTQQGNVGKEFCDKYKLNAWAIKMAAESFCKAPIKIRYRGFRVLINDVDFIMRPNLHMDHLNDMRMLGNLEMRELDELEVNPFAVIMLIKSFITGPREVKRHGIAFRSHDLYISMKYETNTKLLLLTKEDREKYRKLLTGSKL